MATIPLLMQEVGKGNLSLNQTLAELSPETRTTNKGNLTLREILAHQAGLAPWLGFYKETVDVKNARLYLDYYSRKQDEEHTIKVMDNIYIISSIRDTIFDDIYNSPLASKTYKYSDLGYYLIQDILEKRNKDQSLDQQFQEKLALPMGLSATYKPLDKYSLEQIIPTENDKTFRNQLVHGYVHDEGAAMMGGVAGHAGLFSNAIDLAKILQMYLNNGSYGGIQYIKPEVIEDFSKQQFKGNRRAAGFDRIDKVKGKSPSEKSYGHTGFTGTMVWVDSEYGIVYVFLSNRTNTDPDKNLLANRKVRENIRQLLYDAIK